MRKLAEKLKDRVEEKNDEALESDNKDVKRRAVNMDRLEEIYDHILKIKMEK